MGKTCSSGCPRYGSRAEARTANAARKPTKMRVSKRARRATRKRERQNRKG